MSPDRDEYLDEDEGGRFSPRSIFASGWVRAVLVLGALALVLVIAVPYLLQWLDSPQPIKRPQPRSAAERPAPPPAAAPTTATPPLRVPVAPAPVPAEPAKPAVTKGEPAQPAAPVAKAPAPPAQTRAQPEAPLPPKPAAKRAAAPAAETRKAPAPSAGPWWVQVGAFQEARNAERLAGTLRAERLGVEVARVTRQDAGGNRHEVLVTGANAGAVTAVLKGAGTARQTQAGVVIQPPLSLREAVSLSRRLAGEGMSVRIRRVGDAAASTYHVVRVGGYPNRARAEAARKELEAKGLGGFVTRGPAA